MRSKIMSYIAFLAMVIVAAVVSKYSGNIFSGVICGVLALFVLAAVDCVFDYVEEKKTRGKDQSKELADYLQRGLEDGIKRGKTDGLKVGYSFIDEGAAE